MNGLVARHLMAFGQEAIDAFSVILVQGARQVGKSTYAGLLLEGRPHMAVNLDRADLRGSASNDPDGFAAMAGSDCLLVDEIQRVPDLMLAIKAEVDRDRRPGRFVLTGSSDLMALADTPDSLAGRAVTIGLRGLSQGELAGTRDDFAAWVRSGSDFAAGFTSSWARADYAQAMAVGGYPELRTRSGRMRQAWIDSYLERLTSRDLAQAAPGLSVDRLRAILRLVAANQGGELATARIADQLGVSRSSVDTHLAALRTLYLVENLPAWTENLTGREIRRPKAAVTDSSLAMRLNRTSAQMLTSTVATDRLGGLVEAFVVSELTKQRSWSSVDYELFHYRDARGREVDLVMEFADGGVFLIEVKASTGFLPRFFASMRFLAGKLGSRFQGGAVLGMGQQALSFGDGMWGLPLSALWEGSTSGSAARQPVGQPGGQPRSAPVESGFQK